MGIFPYVLKLLQSSARELRPLLVFIWAKILAVDSVSSPCPSGAQGHLHVPRATLLAEPRRPARWRWVPRAGGVPRARCQGPAPLSLPRWPRTSCPAHLPHQVLPALPPGRKGPALPSAAPRSACPAAHTSLPPRTLHAASSPPPTAPGPRGSSVSAGALPSCPGRGDGHAGAQASPVRLGPAARAVTSPPRLPSLRLPASPSSSLRGPRPPSPLQRSRAVLKAVGDADVSRLCPRQGHGPVGTEPCAARPDVAHPTAGGAASVLGVNVGGGSPGRGASTEAIRVAASAGVEAADTRRGPFGAQVLPSGFGPPSFA